MTDVVTVHPGSGVVTFGELIGRAALVGRVNTAPVAGHPAGALRLKSEAYRLAAGGGWVRESVWERAG